MATDSVAKGAMSRRNGLAPISVVVPTRNRAAHLRPMIEACLRHAGGVTLELVVVDDGSEDETPRLLEELAKTTPELVWRRSAARGPGQARNLGAMVASHDTLLFMGDDIRPADAGLFRVHAELHARHPERDLAVLGKVIWPEDSPVTPAMARAQGRGGEQFGFADIAPYSFLDWRFFYTANVSVKRAMVSDWEQDGFSSAFPHAAYEDAELAYRMMEERDPPLRILYAAHAVATHHHAFDAAEFMERQNVTGAMAHVFCELHPGTGVRDQLGLGGVEHALSRPVGAVAAADISELLSMIEGLTSWVRLLDGRGVLGSHYWHDDLLGAVFSLCYLQGYVEQCTRPDANLGAAYQYLVDEFVLAMREAIHIELAGAALADLGSGRVRPGLPRSEHRLKRTALWHWAREQPVLYDSYQTLRRTLAPLLRSLLRRD